MATKDCDKSIIVHTHTQRSHCPGKSRKVLIPTTHRVELQIQTEKVGRYKALSTLPEPEETRPFIDARARAVWLRFAHTDSQDSHSENWSRSGEMSCDSAGVEACRNPPSSSPWSCQSEWQAAMVRMAIGTRLLTCFPSSQMTSLEGWGRSGCEEGCGHSDKQVNNWRSVCSGRRRCPRSSICWASPHRW